VLRSAFLAGLAALLGAAPACAHVVAGARVFPVTLTFDDPGVNDEATLLSFSHLQASGPTNQNNYGFEYDKTITEHTALILNDGLTTITSPAGNRSGWTNLTLTGKWQAYTNAAHEFVVSLGVIHSFGNTGSTQVDDQTGTTAPAAYFGKGLGELPIGMLRPLAITGELYYTVPGRSLKVMTVTDPSTGLVSQQLNNGLGKTWFGGFSVQYSIPYLQSQVRDVGLTGVFSKLIPIVELTWSSAASSPSQQPTTAVAAPGVIYLATWGEIGLEALMPLNRASGTHVGVVGLVHFFFDDLLPNSLGRPIFR